MRKLFSVLCLAAVLAVLPLAQAGAMVLSPAVLNFDDPNNLGVTIGGYDYASPIGSMTWNGTGGGHLYMEYYDNDDKIIFSSPTYVMEFQMNAYPWEGYGTNGGPVSIAAFDAQDQQIWSGTFDLTPYTSWSNWLTVPVNTAGVSYLTFYAPNFAMWPSIDNMVINQPVPVPAAVWLLGSGLVGLAGLRRRIYK